MRDNNGVVASVWPPVAGENRIGCCDEAEVKEWSLVLAAIGIPHTIVRTADGFCLQISSFQMEDAIRELKLWKNQAPLPAAPSSSKEEWVPAWVIPLFLVLFHFYYTIYGNPNTAIALFGISGQGLSRGEFWRPLTALFIHDGMLHLLFNVLLLTLLMPSIKKYTSTASAWTIILLASSIANITAVLCKQDYIVSIGASTSCFLCDWRWSRIANPIFYSYKEQSMDYGDWSGGYFFNIEQRSFNRLRGTYFWARVWFCYWVLDPICQQSKKVAA